MTSMTTRYTNADLNAESIDQFESVRLEREIQKCDVFMVYYDTNCLAGTATVFV
jgi:hypothetical protein